MKHHELLWGSAIVAFVAWVLLAPGPMARIDRTCTPLQWAGSGIVSLTALTAPKYEIDVQDGTHRVVYGCRYSLWRLFSQKNYDAYLAAEHRLPSAMIRGGCHRTPAKGVAGANNPGVPCAQSAAHASRRSTIGVGP